jgi:hypothetical protein
MFNGLLINVLPILFRVIGILRSSGYEVFIKVYIGTGKKIPKY